MNKRIGLILSGVAAAAVMAGGTAYGAVASSQSIPDSSGVIHGCYSANGATGTNGTQLKIIDSTQASCSKRQTAITWNQTGAQDRKARQARRDRKARQARRDRKARQGLTRRPRTPGRARAHLAEPLSAAMCCLRTPYQQGPC